MPYILILVAMVLSSFGYSPAPVMATGAIATASVAYFMSRQPSLLRLLITFAMVALMHFFVVRAFLGISDMHLSEFEETTLRIIMSDTLLLAISAIVMLISIMIGISGPTHLALAESDAKK